ncbi:prolyl oligopeptidase family serine peptidase [Demequina silvatica]|uniref:prolyl oligopeptidase family serine peptidase n=1 Tax=Demequina silvatica TaxID=1638988 RepID=UPI000783A99D|nr:alpha/beta hydrolase-fold protein [Demequina silvatica]
MQRLTTRGTAVAATCLLMTAAATATAAADSGGTIDATVVDATLITEVTPLGYQVAAVAVEYDRELKLGGAGVDADAFDVDVNLAAVGAPGISGDRTVIDAYTAASPEITGKQRAGRYVILELQLDEATSAGTYNDGTFTQFYDLDGGYTVTQTGDIGKRNHVVPAQPDVVVANSAHLDPITDQYAAGTLASAAGPEINYRSYSPDTKPGKKYPLVVTLHGFGESGSNNFSQIAGNQISTAFADPARQKSDPAYVLSPQAEPFNPAKGAWWAPSMQAAVIELVETFIAEHPDVDTSRVYLTGLSMGSYGSWGILTQRSDLFAGAVVVCGAGNEAAAVAELADFPIWAIHSVDDFVVAYDAPGSDYRIFQGVEAAGEPVTWAEWSGLLSDREQEALAKDAVQEARRTGSEHIFWTIPEGTTPLFSHGAWIPTYTNDVILDWLFDQQA